MSTPQGYVPTRDLGQYAASLAELLRLMLTPEYAALKAVRDRAAAVLARWDAGGAWLPLEESTTGSPTSTGGGASETQHDA